MSGGYLYTPGRVALPGFFQPRLAPIMAREALIGSGLDRVYVWRQVSPHSDFVEFCMPGQAWPSDAYPVTETITFRTYGGEGGRVISAAEFLKGCAL